jgi:hypothetical protein
MQAALDLTTHGSVPHTDDNVVSFIAVTCCPATHAPPLLMTAPRHTRPGCVSFPPPCLSLQQLRLPCQLACGLACYLSHLQCGAICRGISVHLTTEQDTSTPSHQQSTLCPCSCDATTSFLWHAPVYIMCPCVTFFCLLLPCCWLAILVTLLGSTAIAPLSRRPVAVELHQSGWTVVPCLQFQSI